MAQLTFKYGVMGSSKTAQALIFAYNCRRLSNTSVTLMRPAIDTRDKPGMISSRLGLESPCFVFDESYVFSLENVFIASGERTLKSTNMLIIDEAQFLTPPQVDQLRDLVSFSDVEVYCYGLKTNYLTHLFHGSQRLLEVADTIECIPYKCACGKPAIYNGRFTETAPYTLITEEDAKQGYIAIGYSYRPLCHECYTMHKDLLEYTHQIQADISAKTVASQITSQDDTEEDSQENSQEDTQEDTKTCKGDKGTQCPYK